MFHSMRLRKNLSKKAVNSDLFRASLQGKTWGSSVSAHEAAEGLDGGRFPAANTGINEDIFSLQRKVDE